MHTATIPYQDNGIDLEGFVAYPDEKIRPIVILCHAWRGRDEFICQKAKEIAEWGYIGFAIDMYGKGIVGSSMEENAALKKPFIEDRHLLQRRVLKGFEVASRLPYADKERIAAVGFGFGGICALDLARTGVDLKGAVTIYGHFDPPPTSKPIRAKVLVLHGYNDLVTPQDELRRFEKEMEEAKVDWQAHIYGGTMHAFATPGAHDPESGILYNPTSALRAGRTVHQFLNEILND